eukprot:9460801-Alexandrium_andersonii.AAC.1
MPQAEEAPPPAGEPESSGVAGGDVGPAPSTPVGKSTAGSAEGAVKSPPPPSTPRSDAKAGAVTSSPGPACDAAKATEAARNF